MIAPMLVPPTRSAVTPTSSRARSAPRCAKPRAPPPDRTTAERAPGQHPRQPGEVAAFAPSDRAGASCSRAALGRSGRMPGAGIAAPGSCRTTRSCRRPGRRPEHPLPSPRPAGPAARRPRGGRRDRPGDGRGGPRRRRCRRSRRRRGGGRPRSVWSCASSQPSGEAARTEGPALEEKRQIPGERRRRSTPAVSGRTAIVDEVVSDCPRNGVGLPAAPGEEARDPQGRLREPA